MPGAAAAAAAGGFFATHPVLTSSTESGSPLATAITLVAVALVAAITIVEAWRLMKFPRDK